MAEAAKTEAGKTDAGKPVTVATADIPAQAAGAEVSANREDAGSTKPATDVRVPLTPAEQKRIATALGEPMALAETEAGDATDTGASSPLGFWVTELDSTKVHIVPCGKELCGYAVDEKTLKDGTEPIVRMKPAGARKWTGRVSDAHGTGSYLSTISQHGADILHVQGCAFKGFMCDGQIWRRAS